MAMTAFADSVNRIRLLAINKKNAISHSDIANALSSLCDIKNDNIADLRDHDHDKDKDNDVENDKDTYDSTLIFKTNNKRLKTGSGLIKPIAMNNN